MAEAIVEYFNRGFDELWLIPQVKIF
jgi:hypothetical protein